MKYLYCPKCTVKFPADKDQCPNCGNYAIHCEEVETHLEYKNPDFHIEYIRKLCDDSSLFERALKGYKSNFVPEIKLKPDENSPVQSFDLEVHSFTKEKYYRVNGCFDEHGLLIDAHCECDDFLFRNRYCKHIIAVLMKSYVTYCEDKYGKLIVEKPKVINTSPIKQTNTVSNENKSTTPVKPNKKETILHFIIAILVCLAIGYVVGFGLWFLISIFSNLEPGSSEWIWFASGGIVSAILFVVWLILLKNTTSNK